MKINTLAIDLQEAAKNVEVSSLFPAARHYWAQKAYKAALQMVILTQDQVDNRGECETEQEQDALK